MSIDLHRKEFRETRVYASAILIFIMLSYSIYFYLSENTISKLGKEDGFFEYLTAALFFTTSILFFLLNQRKRKMIIMIFSFVMFVGAGEEISWGQRIFHFQTPESLSRVNVQKEFTLHNIYLFDGADIEGNPRRGWSRLFHIDFLFRMFIMVFGILLPISVFYCKFTSKIAQKLKVPVPPLLIGIFFLINWLTFRILLSHFLLTGMQYQYYDTIPEIFECGSAFILMVIAIYFIKRINTDFLGKDIKQMIKNSIV